MNIALVVAGGAGIRTGQSVPKQFLTVNDKPIIIYTLENIDEFKNIDAVVAVIPSGWENFLNAYVKQFGIKKLEKIIFGGNSRFDSVYRGLNYILENYSNDDIVLIVDANRPLIPHDVFIRALKSIDNRCDFSVACESCYDSMYHSCNTEYIDDVLKREHIFKGQSPECGRVGEIISLYNDAKTKGIEDKSMGELCIALNKKIKIVEGSAMSFKITTKDDLKIFRALLSSF